MTTHQMAIDTQAYVQTSSSNPWN